MLFHFCHSFNLLCYFSTLWTYCVGPLTTISTSMISSNMLVYTSKTTINVWHFMGRHLIIDIYPTSDISQNQLVWMKVKLKLFECFSLPCLLLLHGCLPWRGGHSPPSLKVAKQFQSQNMQSSNQPFCGWSKPWKAPNGRTNNQIFMPTELKFGGKVSKNCFQVLLHHKFDWWISSERINQQQTFEFPKEMTENLLSIDVQPRFGLLRSSWYPTGLWGRGCHWTQT